jgi:glycine/D-amino acid oxidase-like deaminating enzyme
VTATTLDPLALLDPRPLWQTQVPPDRDRSKAPLPDAADLVVVGGGYTGIAAARRAALLGASSVVLEAETLGWGASTRNGGMVHPGFKWELDELLERHGPDLGRRLYDESLEAFDWTATTIAEEGIEADYVASGHLELAFAPAHVELLQRTARSLAATGVPARFIPRDRLGGEIGTRAYFGGLLVDRSGGLHPARYHRGLTAAAERAGAGLHDRVRALRIRRQADGRSVVETDRGAILAREVLVATNGYADGLLPWTRRRVLSIGSYIIATEPLPDGLPEALSPNGRMFFDSKNFLYYWRITPDRRMLFGGRVSFWPTTNSETARRLYAGMIAVHPQLRGRRVEFAWGGRIGFTVDRMPHVGRVGGVSYATGCCGTGVAMMPWLGDRAARWLLGDAPAPALSELRFPLVPAPYEGRAWFLPIVGEWFRFRDALAARSRPALAPARSPAAETAMGTPPDDGTGPSSRPG